MKWLLISMALWGDGNYTFMPSFGPSYDDEASCIAAKSGLRSSFMMAGQPAAYYGYICAPGDAWSNFTFNWKGTR